MTFLGMILVVFLLLRMFSTPKVPRERTLEAYLKRHPGCLQQGRVTCYRCGASNLWMKQCQAYPGGVIHSHVCRQCGIELYQSVWR
jgi:hypothetical protein